MDERYGHFVTLAMNISLSTLLIEFPQYPLAIEMI